MTIAVVALALTPLIALLVAIVRLGAERPKNANTGNLPLWTGVAAMIDPPAAAPPTTHDPTDG